MIRLLLSLALCAAPARAAESGFSFMVDDREALRVTAASLGARSDVRLISIADPFYGKRKRYRAVPFKNLLTAAYGPAWIEDGVGEFFFEALDGYRSHARVPILADEGGMLAFADADVLDWEEMPEKKIRPGPFYLVWIGAEQTPKKGYPWPWQLVSVRSGIVEDQFPKAVPRNAAPKSRAPAGWAIFRRSCISCHAISGQGGSVGPDLNEPRGVTRYRDKKELKAYIRKPSEFRHTKMPDFDELTSSDLNDLMAYFDFISVQAGTN